MSNFDPQPIRGAFVSELNEDGEYGDMYGDKAKRSPMYTKHANPVELQTRNAGGGGYMQGESPYANSAMGNYDHRGGHRGGSEMGQGMGRSEEEMDKTAPEVMSDSWLQIEVNKINIFWILVSTGYMVSWTSIGSLIAYFKARQGARFYVKLYCCFYLPGLPVSLLQQKYDEKLDKMFGSANSFLIRVVLSMMATISLLLFMPFVPDMVSIDDVPNVILLCMILIGSFSWLCHGTASMLCSMFPPSSMAYMQTGFRTPEIYTVVILSILGLNSRASEADVVTFYWITALVVGLGLFSWLRVCRSKPAMHYFALKDESYNETDAQDQSEKSSLLAPSYGMLEDSSTGAPMAEGKRPVMVEDQAYVAKIIRPCRVAIFLNIWTSIFSAAFFAYVQPAGKTDVEIILYFTRLFSDLIGRPLARCPRPWFCKNKEQIVKIAWARISLMFVFFGYIAFPGLFPRSDIFIVVVVCVFSVLSGYLAVLSYEYAAASLETKAGQSVCGTLMNSTFQMACFTAVISSVMVSESGFIDEPGDER